jgi:hypothetical protein
MEEPDMRIDPLDDLAVEFENEAQDTVGRRVLRAEIDGEIADRMLGHQMPSAASNHDADALLFRLPPFCSDRLDHENHSPREAFSSPGRT